MALVYLFITLYMKYNSQEAIKKLSEVATYVGLM